MSHPLDARWRALESDYAELYPGSDLRPLRRLVGAMRAAERERKTEFFLELLNHLTERLQEANAKKIIPINRGRK